MRKRLLGLAASAVILVSACGGGDNADSADTTAATRTKNAARREEDYSDITIARPTTTTAAAVPTTLAPVAIPKTTTPAPSAKSCVAQGPCIVGQTGPAGGIVFYAAATPQSWGQYMEVRPEVFEQIVVDSCNLDAYNSYATGKIGDGLTQTNAVIAACAKDGRPAAAGSWARVDAYTQNGFDDWFIPSKDELQQLAISKVVTFARDKDLTSGTWVKAPIGVNNRSSYLVWGVKREVIAGRARTLRADGIPHVEIMTNLDNVQRQVLLNLGNRWGWIYIARAFGPKA